VFEVFECDGPGWNDSDRAFSQEAKAAALDVAAKMVAGWTGHVFALLGQTSVGKTFLMRLLWRFFLRSVPYANYPGTEPPSHAGWINWPKHHWQELDDHETTRFLVIDEIGRGKRATTSSDWDDLVALLSIREHAKLWTGVTANLTFEQIRKIDAALAERLRRNGGVCIQALGDVRPYDTRKL